MIKQLANIFSEFFCRKGVISVEKSHIYSYGFELLISTVINLLGVIVISIIFGDMLKSFLFILSFIPMRLSAGGYHAKKHITCILGFNLIFLSFMIFVEWLSLDMLVYYSIISATISTILVFVLSPIEAVNKPLKPDKKIRQRKRSLQLVLFNFVVALVVLAVPEYIANLFVFYNTGVFCSAVLLVVAKIYNEI